jgi:hypothetical protein
MFQERIAKFNATIAVRRALTFCRRSVGAGTLRRSEGLAGHILKICKGHRHAARSCCPVFDQLHPKIYAAAVGLVAWFVVSAWVFFDRKGQIGLSLAFVSVLLLIRGSVALVAVAGLEAAPRTSGGANYEDVIPRLADRRFRGLGSQASRHACRDRRVAAACGGRLRSDGDRKRLRDRGRHIALGRAATLSAVRHLQRTAGRIRDAGCAAATAHHRIEPVALLLEARDDRPL